MEKYRNKFEEIVENSKTNINEISNTNDDVEMVTQMSSELHIIQRIRLWIH